MSLRNSRQGDKTPPGPGHQASRPAERGPPAGANSGGVAGRTSGMMVFSQVFVLAPIRSQDAELVFDVTQATHGSVASSPSRSIVAEAGACGGGGGVGEAVGGGGGHTRSSGPKRVGSCRVSLRELADQREHDLPLTVLKKAR